MTTIKNMLKLFLVLLFVSSLPSFSQRARHTFILGDSEFLLDGKPFQIISGELHPARIPAEYWRHRIRMAKAMGCNTISANVFWNYHENEEDVYDFSTGNHNIGEFIKIVQQEDMWLILRPGPYVCAEWESGGIPPYLLRISDIKLRSLDTRYMLAAERYIARLADVIKPFLITKGGPLLMVQIENEYGSYGNDKEYLLRLREVWKKCGINIPTFTGDGSSESMLKAGTLPGSAVGLDSGSSQPDFDLAVKINPGVPVFSCETYTGQLTHWGENWARPDTTLLYKEIKFLMDNRRSFNLYVINGGTNFGFTAGANSGYKGYEPAVTSYDYDAPVDEQGRATRKYMVLREIIGSYLDKGEKLPSLPDPIAAIEVQPVNMQKFTSMWDNLPEPDNSVNTKTFEECSQDYGFMLYRTKVPAGKSGTLVVDEIHDYATVFLDGQYIGALDRREGINSINIPEPNEENKFLEILVEAMGRINSGKDLADRKGITGSVSLNGVQLSGWEIYNFPMDRKFIYDLRSTGRTLNKPGIFFKGNFSLAYTGDTFFDISNYTKGVVWVNGHNLGRYWSIGPQKRLYCPASWMRPGMNEIIIFDLHQTESRFVSGYASPE